VSGSSAVQRVGVMGLGRMGSAIATRLTGTFDVRGWDVRSVSLDGVERAASAAELLADREVVISCLPSPRETSAVVEDPVFAVAFAASDAVIVDASTSDPDSLRALASRLGAAGARLVDGPILGRPDRVGAWTIPVGGEPFAVERARSVLRHLAERVEPVGPLGAAHTMKLLNNLMFGAINVVTAEAIAACDRLGVDPARFVDLVMSSKAATVSPLFQALAPRMLGSDAPVVFSAALLAKDVDLAWTMCQRAGVPVRLAPHVAAAAADAVAAGHGDEDSAALIEIYRDATFERDSKAVSDGGLGGG